MGEVTYTVTKKPKYSVTKASWSKRELAKDPLDTSLDEARLVGAGRGLTNAFENIVQPFKDEGWTKAAQGERDLYARAKGKESPGTQMAMGASEVLGETLPYAAIPASSAGAISARVGTSMAAGGVMGATQFVPPGEDEAKTRVGNAGIGVLSAGGTSLGLGLTARNALTPLTGKAGELDALSKEHGIDLTYGDIRGGTPARAESVLEQIPFVGLSRFRAAQQNQAEIAAKRAKAGFNTLTPEAWQIAAQDSIKSRLATLKHVEDGMYKKVSDQADKLGPIPVPKTIQRIDELLTKEGSAIEPDQRVIEDLVAKRGALYDAWKQGGNFSKLRDFRSDLGEKISEYYTGKNSLLGESGVQTYQQLRLAINDDMEGFAKQAGGKLYSDWKAADTFHRLKVVPYREQALLRTLANEADPDAVYRMFLSGAHSKPTVLYQGMGAKGRAAVRAGMIEDAFNKSVDERTGFSPAKFASALKKRETEIGVFFRGSDRSEIEGLMKLMAHAERANKPGAMPINGSQLVPFIVGGGAVGGAMTSLPATAMATSGIYLMSKLLTSDAGKRMLLRAKDAQPGKGVQAVLDNFAPKLGAVFAEQAMQ